MTPDDARRQLALRQNLSTQLGTLAAKAHELACTSQVTLCIAPSRRSGTRSRARSKPPAKPLAASNRKRAPMRTLTKQDLAASEEGAGKTVTINMRARRSVVDQIDKAAETMGMSRSKFIRLASIVRAKAILAEHMAAQKPRKR